MIANYQKKDKIFEESLLDITRKFVRKVETSKLVINRSISAEPFKPSTILDFEISFQNSPSKSYKLER